MVVRGQIQIATVKVPEFQPIGSMSGMASASKPALGKLLPFKLPRPVLKLIQQLTPQPCSACQHKLDGHIFHPSGMRVCAERGCFCRIHVWDK